VSISAPQAVSCVDDDGPGKTTTLVTIVLLAVAIMAAPAAPAQTLSILHTFTGADGSAPLAGPTLDRTGSLYGTTLSQGGGFGTVFKLTHAGTSWVMNTLHTFQGGSDGAGPAAGVVFGPDGALYGTTTGIDGGSDYGTVFMLRPPANAPHSIIFPWTETVLYRFTGGADGANPGYGNLIFDAAGNIYGTTVRGGDNGLGTVYELTPSNGSWTETVLYSFSMSDNGGYYPYGAVVLDSSGNLYGTTYLGGITGLGSLFELTPSGSSWTETLLHSFGTGDGYNPYGGLIIDQQDNLYGTTASGPGNQTGGTAYELQPAGTNWTYTILAALPAQLGMIGPLDALTMDAAGNLYGTSNEGLSTYGGVFKLTPSGGSWIYTDLHDFMDGDGAYPYGSVAVDAHGNIYGTTYSSSPGDGEVWMITP